MSSFALNLPAMRHGGSFWANLASAWVAGLLLAGPVYTLEPPRLPTDSAPPVTYLAANEFRGCLIHRRWNERGDRAVRAVGAQ
jgi:hypothetical protein